MDSRLLKSAILALLVLSLLTARPQTINAHKAGSTFQAWAAASPSIDGNIGTDEWKYADSRDFDLGGGYTGTLYVMNDANNLYIAAKVVDDNFEDGAWPDTDGFYLLFDNDNNGVWPEDYDEYIYISSNDFVDGVIIGSLKTDDSEGGTEDGSGAMSDGGGENLFEISHPLDSADNSYDFSLTAGDTVGFRMRYHDGDGSGYTSAWGGDTGAEFGDIVVASSPPTLSAYTTVTPTIDGTIDTATEWADADTATIIFGWTYNGTLYVMNDANNLYIAAKIADADFTGNDFLVILFDNNGDGVGREDGDEQMQLVGSTYSD
ncbi:hypothetical protein, partial [[Eubacterium] cellulosolvens]